MTDQEITKLKIASESVGRHAAAMCESNTVQWLAALGKQIAAGGKRQIKATLNITLAETTDGVLMVAVDVPELKIKATTKDEGEMVPLLGDDPAARLPGLRDAYPDKL